MEEGHGPPEGLVHPSLGPLAVVVTPPARVYELRQAVLRPHQGVEEMPVAGEDGPDALTLAAVTAGDEVVSTACVVPDPPPGSLAALVPAGRAFRLRAMATSPRARRAGVGSAVLAAALSHVAARGGVVLWCNARIAAVPFYERAGFVAHGEVFEVPVIGRHVVMWRPSAACPGEERPSP